MDEPFADAVVVAAGASRRMGGADKLDAPLAGRTLLAWSVDAMARARCVRRVVVVVAPEQVERMSAVEWLAQRTARVVAGGASRSDSVLAGVGQCDADIVLVHDGARPLASSALVDRVARAAAEHGAAIPVVTVSDSLKRLADGFVSGAVEREGVAAAQTPQAARRDLLLDAFAASDGRAFADEAGMLTAHGVPVAAIPGEAANIKVTRPDDLELVRALGVARLHGAVGRTGLGRDSHQFGRRTGLWLGGVLIAEAPRLHGHSDGDAVLHAVATAVLSAAGLGDLGRLFPPDEGETSGAASSGLLTASVARARHAGWRASSASISLLAARPRLGPRLDLMRSVIAALLEAPPESIAVTASTGNLSGPEGKGLAISATALVTMVPT